MAFEVGMSMKIASSISQNNTTDQKDKLSLATRATKFQVKNNAVDRLLKILQQQNHTDRPSSACMLLKTPLHVATTKTWMEYVHYHLHEKLLDYLEKCSAEELQDIDYSNFLPLLIVYHYLRVQQSHSRKCLIHSLWCSSKSFCLWHKTGWCTGYYVTKRANSLIESPFRTLKTSQINAPFRCQVQSQHRSDSTPQVQISMEIIKNFLTDEMHQSCLGVMKKWLLSWTTGVRGDRLSKHSKTKEVITSLLQFRSEIWHLSKPGWAFIS